MASKILPNIDLLGLSKRISGHFFWYMTGYFVQMGLPQLLLFPLCMHLVGEESFGKFIYAYGIVSMIGLAPTKGLIDTFLRNIASISESRRNLFLSTILILAAFSVGILLLLAGIVLSITAGFVAERQLLVWIGFIAIAFAAQNMVAIKLTSFSFQRQFALRAFWQTLESLAGFGAIPCIILFGVWGLPIGYIIGHITVFLLLYFVHGHSLRKGISFFDFNMAKRIITTWLVLSGSIVFLLSSRYIHRSILGFWSDYEAVSTFFVATAVLEIFVMPLNIMGLFGFSILSRHSSTKLFSKRFCGLYSVASLMIAIVFYVLILLLSKYMLRIMYPSVAEAAWKLVPITAIGVSMTVLVHFVRPFVIKFSSSKTILAISIISFIAHTCTAFLLIPKWNITGAVYAYCIGNSVVGLTWMIIFIDRFIFRREQYTLSTLLDNIDSEAGCSPAING